MLYNGIRKGGDLVFTWIKNHSNQYVLTLSSTSITLNASAATLFQDVRYCMVGINEQQQCFAIRPVSKDEIDKHIVDSNSLHKITIGKGYGRITSKIIMEQLSNLLNRDLDALKVAADYDEKHQYLICDYRSYMNEGGR